MVDKKDILEMRVGDGVGVGFGTERRWTERESSVLFYGRKVFRNCTSNIVKSLPTTEL